MEACEGSRREASMSDNMGMCFCFGDDGAAGGTTVDVEEEAMAFHANFCSSSLNKKKDVSLTSRVYR